jgi:hypothetical protein
MPRTRRNPDLHPALLAADGTRYFSDAALAEADHEGGAYKSRTALVLMDPSDFIRMAMPGTRSEATELVGRLMQEGTRFNDVPRLFVSYDEETGVAEVKGHEGRHRSRALLARGVRQMPVRIHTNNLRWSEQSRPSSWDYVKVLPHTLIGEGANRANRMPMPIPIHYPELEARMRKQNQRRLAMRRNTAHAASGLTDEKMLRLACVGMCGEFAVALQNVYGYPLGAFYEVGSDGYDEGDFTLLHAFAYHPSKKVVDSAGIRAKKDVRADLLVMSGGKIEEHPTTAGDIDALSMSGLDADVLAHAEDYVRARPEVYGPSRTNPAPRVPRGFRDLAAWSKWADGQGVDLRLSRTPYGGVEITDLFAHTTGTGAGTRVVTALVSAADTAGMPLVLEPSSRRNITFYERFGFVVSPRGTAMIRSPRRSR